MATVLQTIEQEPHEMRAVFAQVMDELAGADDRVIYLDADLANSIGMAPFSKKYPEQFVDCGIQEANMVGAAAGMSATGMIPFVHTFGPFASRRVMDQVFISAAYAKLNIRMISSDPGVTASLNGGTHMPFEDIGMWRCVPEVTILEPTDSVMLADLLRQTKEQWGVFYIRLSRKKSMQVFEVGSRFTIGRAEKLRDGEDVSIFATGVCVAEALKAREALLADGISAAVYNPFTIKPIDRDAVVKAARATGAVVTAENHNVIGGLGSAVAEVLGEAYPVPLERVGVWDCFGEVGDVAYLMERFGLTAGDIVAKAKRAVERKGQLAVVKTAANAL